MVKRKASKGANAGNFFWGCSTYPRCRGVLAFEGEGKPCTGAAFRRNWLGSRAKWQSQIEQIKIARLTTFKWAFLTGQLLWWIPFVLVLFKGLLGVDLYTVSAFMPTFIAWNIGFGVAFIPVALWASKLLVGKLGGLPKFQKFTDGIAGSDVVAAREFMVKLAEFEREADGR